ncbi:MAG: glycosyltransferase family 2 protein [Bacteroidota bacterium]
MEPTVSVVVPSYNQAKYLRATLQSVVDQQYPRKQLIVVDGGSTDGSVEIIKEFGKECSYWCSERDEGQPQAIAKGFRRATGELMTYLNSDDVLLPGAIENVVRAFDGSPRVLLFGHHVVIDEEGRVRERVKVPPHVRWISWKMNPVFSQPGTFFTRSVYESVGGIDTSLQYSFDLDLFLKFMKEGARFVHTHRFLAGFRRHTDQKGLSRKWLEICDQNTREIERRYSAFRGSRLAQTFARTGHFMLQLATLNYFYTYGFRMLKEGRVKSYDPGYSD